jgi:dihydrofolate reductase
MGQGQGSDTSVILAAAGEAAKHLVQSVAPATPASPIAAPAAARSRPCPDRHGCPDQRVPAHLPRPAPEGEPDFKLSGQLHRDHRPWLRCGELEAMLIFSMGVSVDGFIADREGAFGWTAPNEEQFRFHIAQVRELGCYLCGRRLYETMLPWETDPSMRDDELGAAFADVWGAIPKVVFSRTLDSVQGNARLAEASVAEEAAAAIDATDKDVSIGGAG